MVGFSDFQEFYSSGLGVSDLLALTYGDVKEEFETRYYALMPKLNTKTGVSFMTFLDCVLWMQYQ
jgi:hypothetical protein